MSFYLDDDDPYYSSSTRPIKQEDDEGFICENCGGNDFYVDASTGAHCCGSCFTQSQSVVPASQGAGESALEFEEIMGLAARTRGGRLVQQRAPTKRANSSDGRKTWQQQRPRQPLEELDRSVPLPDLMACLWAIQRVLQRAAICVADLVVMATKDGDTNNNIHESNSSFRQVVVTTVQTIWNNYLKTWREGAEYYKRRHPEIRFSFRDCFLGGQSKVLLLRHLSHQASLRVKKELDEENDNNDALSLSSSEAEEEEEAASDKPIENKVISSRKCASAGAIRSMLLKYYPSVKGRKEAALVLQPSMSLSAAIIWLAVRHLGITSFHIAQWIGNGSLPLINAFDTILYPSCDQDSDKVKDVAAAAQRKASLRVVSSFFRMSVPPRPAYLEHLAKLVAFCSGVVPSKELTVPSVKQLRRDNKLGRDKEQNNWEFQSLSSQSIPFVTARMVSDLGMDQNVLNMALALMGLYPTSNPETLKSVWNPPTEDDPTDEQEVKATSTQPPTRPLDRAKNISTLTQVAGVIVTACKLSPGWESWVYRVVHQRQRQDRQEEQQQDGSKAERFVPWNDQDVRLLTNGPSLESYIDFLDENLAKDDNDSTINSLFGEFPVTTTVETPEAVDWRSRDQPDGFASQQFNHDASEARYEGAMIAGSANPNQPNIRERYKHHEWFLALRKPKVVWADVNGLGHYVVYRDVANETRYQRNGGSKPLLPSHSLEALHPHYVLLLEYVAYVTRLPIRRIHGFVTELDAEIQRKSASRRKRKHESV